MCVCVCEFVIRMCENVCCVVLVAGVNLKFQIWISLNLPHALSLFPICHFILLVETHVYLFIPVYCFYY